MKFRDDPVVIGAIGGSGTRVFTKIVRHAGIFMGSHLNQSEDAEPFVDFYTAWISLYLHKAECLPEPVKNVLDEDFSKCLEQHLLELPSLEERWGIKNPKSIHMLKLWDETFPRMKFIHVIRNGLDVVYSRTQSQFYSYRTLILDEQEQCFSGSSAMILFWDKVNQLAANFGETYLKDRYLRIRFEDLCNYPNPTVTKIFDFLEVSDASKLADAVAEITSPSTINRWQTRSVREVYGMIKTGDSGLKRFGYWNEHVWNQIEHAANASPLERYLFQKRSMKKLNLNFK